MGYVLAILALGLLVVVHETGHYLVAKMFKMRVDRFSIGFGPAIVKWKRNGTEFQFSPLLLGGFVQIAGMNPHEDVDPDDPAIYPNRPTYQRFLAILAGPAFNYLSAIVMVFFIYTVAGAETDKATTYVMNVAEGQPASGVLLPKDKILTVGGAKVDHLSSFRTLVQASEGKPIEVTVERGGQPTTVTLTPALVPDSNPPLYRVGVELDFGEIVRERVGVLTAAKASVVYPIIKSQQILDGLYKTIRREIPLEVSSPVGIVKVIKKQNEYGWVRGFELLAMLSVYLGLFNLLPFPALDGGRLVFLGYELATRRRPNPRVEAMVHMAGFVVLFSVMILVLYKDIFL